MDPVIQQILAQAAAVAARTGVETIHARITAAKQHTNEETRMAAMQELVNELNQDRQELISIVNDLRAQFVAEQLDAEELEHITNTVMPIVSQLITHAEVDDSSIAEGEGQQIIDLISALLASQTLSVLQTIGFNFKQGIGIPLTNVVATLIYARFGLMSNAADGQSIDVQDQTT